MPSTPPAFQLPSTPGSTNPSYGLNTQTTTDDSIPNELIEEDSAPIDPNIQAEVQASLDDPLWLHNKKLVMSDQKMPNQGPGSSSLFNSSEPVSSPPKFDYDAVEAASSAEIEESDGPSEKAKGKRRLGE